MFRWMVRLKLVPRRHYCFIFHRLLAERDELMPGIPTVQEFEAQLLQIKQHFRVIPMVDTLTTALDNRPTASISFDDGYADNLHLLAPLLRKHQAHATVFCTTAFLKGDLMWNDWLIEFVRQSPPGLMDLSEFDLGIYDLPVAIEKRRSTLKHLLMTVKYWPSEQRIAFIHFVRTQVPNPPRLMLNENEMRSFDRQTLHIGGHTHDHHVLTTTSSNEARWQIEHNRGVLTDILGEAPRLFAFPNGKPETDYRREHLHMIRKAGYEAAWTTENGAWDNQTDRYQIPRFTPWRWSMLHFTKDLAQISRREPLLLKA